MPTDIASWLNPDGTVELAGYITDAPGRVGKAVHLLRPGHRPPCKLHIVSPVELTFFIINTGGTVELAEIRPRDRPTAHLDGIRFSMH